MRHIEKWCRVHKKACLVTGIMGLLLAPFLWPVFLAVIVQSLTIGLPIAAGICCYKYLNEKRRKRMRMNKNAIILKQNNQLPVKYANMLKRPAVFQKVRMKRGQNR